MDLKVKIVDSLSDLEALKDGWLRLAATIPDNTDAFSGWEFIHATVKFYQPKDWFVVVIFDAVDMTMPVATFPLRSLSVATGQKTLLACEAMSLRYCTYIDYQMLDQYRGAAWAVLLDLLGKHRHYDVLYVGQLHQNSRNYLHLRDALPAEKIKVLRKPALPYIDARQGDFISFCAGKKKATLADARRCERRLAEIGKLEFILANDQATVRDQVRELCRINIEMFGDHHLHGKDRVWIEFLAMLTYDYVDAGFVELSTLRLNGKDIAWSLNLHYKGRRYHYQSAYLPKYKACSPSKVLLVKMIERTFAERGIFCFGPGLFGYKVDWSQAIDDLTFSWVFFNDAARQELETMTTWETANQWYIA